MLSDWQTELPFDSMYDRDEVQVYDVKDAHVAMVEVNADWWIAILLSEWDLPTLH